jgi:hypothetical protein
MLIIYKNMVQYYNKDIHAFLSAIQNIFKQYTIKVENRDILYKE